MTTKVLFIHHSGCLGGGSLSLLYMMQGIRSHGFQPIVALTIPSKKLEELYKQSGFEVITWTGITLWHHSTVAVKTWYNPRTWIHLKKVIFNWQQSQQRTLELVEYVKPDIVHLNSMPLSPSAAALSKNNIPHVWHIREPPPDRGIRTKLISQIMLKSNQLIFISNADKQAWVEGKKGDVIHNFVNFHQFDADINGTTIRQQLNIPLNSHVILYLGGISVVKGIFILLEALEILRHEFYNLRCLMPGMINQTSNSWKSKTARYILPKIGYGTLQQRVEQKIEQLNLEQVCIKLPFQTNVAPLFAASEILAFPSTRPHFARPVIEAGAMGKPVVASNFDGMNELVEDRKTGYLIPANKPDALAEKLEIILKDKNLATTLGISGKAMAVENFELNSQIEKLIKIYDSLL